MTRAKNNRPAASGAPPAAALPCYVVAVIDANHNGDLAEARWLVEAAAAAGADAVKLRRRTVELAGVATVLGQPMPRHRSLGATYGEQLARLELKQADLAALRTAAKTQGVEFILAPYDTPALRDVRALEPDAVQVDAPAALHRPLLEALCSVAWPTFVSTDGCSAAEVRTLVEVLDRSDLVLLCDVLSIGRDTALDALRRYLWLQGFGRPVGWADREPDGRWGQAAALLGARVVEKGLTRSRALEGPDHAGSLTPEEFGALVHAIRSAEAHRGNGVDNRRAVDLDALQDVRPSLVAARRIARGSQITAAMLAAKPPMLGLAPSLAPQVVGRQALYDIEEGAFITFGLISA